MPRGSGTGPDEVAVRRRLDELAAERRLLRRQLRLSQAYRDEIDSRKETTPSAGENLAVGA